MADAEDSQGKYGDHGIDVITPWDECGRSHNYHADNARNAHDEGVFEVLQHLRHFQEEVGELDFL